MTLSAEGPIRKEYYFWPVPNIYPQLFRITTALPNEVYNYLRSIFSEMVGYFNSFLSFKFSHTEGPLVSHTIGTIGIIILLKPCQFDHYIVSLLIRSTCTCRTYLHQYHLHEHILFLAITIEFINLFIL